MIALTSFQKAALRKLKKLRCAILLWRRQGGKTTLFSWVILRHLAEVPGSFITFVSASLSVGTEIPHRTTQLFNELLDTLRQVSGEKGPEILSNGEGLDEDKLIDMFKQGRLEIHFRHSKTVVSRMKVIAPNVATARGYSGWVIMDEIGFIHDFKELFEAMEPIISRDPTFHLFMATTPPNDDSHFSYELAQPEPGTTFSINPDGNWYVAQSGIEVHRVDAYDAEAAGVHLYDMNTGKPLTPEQHRAKALDRDAWDRNYALLWLQGGTSALSTMSLSMAQDRGAHLSCISADRDLPDGWALSLTDAPWAIGMDPATTENNTSNPSSLVLTQQIGPLEFAERLVFRFKTADDRESKALLREIIEAAIDRTGRKPRRISVDGTSERYFCSQIKREFSKYGPVEILVSSESIEWRGETMKVKSYLGNQYVNAYDDGQMAIPPARWVREDRRLVKKCKGSFDNAQDSSGNHGDTFDAGKNALHGLLKKGGPCEAKAIRVGAGTGSSIIS
jgi:hypothetical protein